MRYHIICLALCLTYFVGCAHQPQTVRKDKARSESTHVVAKGDTLYSIAKQYQVSVDEIVKANRLSQNTNLAVGQPLRIPGSSGQALPAPVTQKAAEDAKQIDLAWPVAKGVVFRTFDQNAARLHEGLSIGAPANTPVRSAQDGEVIYAAQAPNHLGRMVLIKHADPFVSIYGHLDEVKVKVGQKLKKGDIIGTVGTSGDVESPRVYFELRKDRMPVNPEPYLPKG